MIVPMKKIFLLILNSQKEQALINLKELGAVHLEDIKGSGEKLEEMQAERDLVHRSILALPELSKGTVGKSGKTPDRLEVTEIAKRIIDRYEQLKGLKDEVTAVLKELDRISIWGDFDPGDVSFLKESGVNIKLYELTQEQQKLIPENVVSFRVARKKAKSCFAIITDEEMPENLEETALPETGLNELNLVLDSRKKEMKAVEKELEILAESRSDLKNLLEKLDDEIEFENVYTGLNSEGSISYLQGYIPSERSDELKKVSAENGWGIMLSDPEADDHVPTLVENSKTVRIIKPVFNIIGIIPGYREKDISFFFLIFLSLFFAMIIGDGGYGLLFLGLSVFMSIKLKKATGKVPDAAKLFTEMSFLTVIWGAITGTWFGSETIANIPFINSLIIDRIASFSQSDTTRFIMHICFVIGTVHLSIAHIWNFIAMLKQKPVIKAFSQLGWLSMVLGLYFLVLQLVFGGTDFPMPDFALYMIAGGLGGVILFSNQEGNFFKGILKGFAGLMNTFLDSISVFSDIISYIRLFAVGLATVAVASSFNAMAASLGSGVVGIIGSILILGLGHSLNLAMAALSVVVHGIRLNVLEFSGHLGMEWTGVDYNPFRNKLKK